VEEGHQLGEVGFGEIVGAQAGVEFRHAEVDRIGPGGDGGAGAVPVAGGAEEFGREVGVHEGELAGERGNVECGDGIWWSCEGRGLFLGKGEWIEPFFA